MLAGWSAGCPAPGSLLSVEKRAHITEMCLLVSWLGQFADEAKELKDHIIIRRETFGANTPRERNKRAR